MYFISNKSWGNMECNRNSIQWWYKPCFANIRVTALNLARQTDSAESVVWRLIPDNRFLCKVCFFDGTWFGCSDWFSVVHLFICLSHNCHNRFSQLFERVVKKVTIRFLPLWKVKQSIKIIRDKDNIGNSSE